MGRLSDGKVGSAEIGPSLRESEVEGETSVRRQRSTEAGGRDPTGTYRNTEQKRMFAVLSKVETGESIAK